VKPYKKAKKMMDAVMALYSPEGRQGTAVYSCAADQLIRGKNFF